MFLFISTPLLIVVVFFLLAFLLHSLEVIRIRNKIDKLEKLIKELLSKHFE